MEVEPAMEHVVQLPDDSAQLQAPEEQQLLINDVMVNDDWTWVVDIEKALRISEGANANVQRQRRTSCIYRVPERNRNLSVGNYTPQLVSFGPFHHHLPSLQPMEEHKHRALLHFLRRACKPLSAFVAAMEDAAEQLEGMYDGLPEAWRNRRRFVQLMVMDGCFMLEVVRAATARAQNDYHVDDPVFGWHGTVNTMPYFRHDMLLIENQLPLLALEKLVTVESGRPDPSGHLINKQVLKFLSPSTRLHENIVLEGLHPLDLFRWSRVHEEMSIPSKTSLTTSPYDVTKDVDYVPVRPTSDISATALHDAGIHVRKLDSKKISDIRLAGDVFHLRTLTVDELTEPIFTNLVAFERLHIGLNWPFRLTAYLFFMSKIIKSAEDVSFLSSKGIIRNALGDDQKVAELFRRLSDDLHVYPLEEGSRLATVHQQLEKHCQKNWNIWRAHIARKYFRNPWAPLSLAGSVFFLMITVAANINLQRCTSPSLITQHIFSTLSKKSR